MNNPIQDDITKVRLWFFERWFFKYIKSIFPGIYIHPENAKKLKDIDYITFTKITEQYLVRTKAPKQVTPKKTTPRKKTTKPVLVPKKKTKTKGK